MNRKRLKIIGIIIFIFLYVQFSPAQSIILIPQKHLPTYLIAVDKSKQRLFLLGYNGSLNIISQMCCSTGSNSGDKFLQGDEKTPEGIYFITRKVKRPLDVSLYGNLAYATNYPNPVDRLFDKDGKGIWLHGRGKKLVPYDTRGCIAVKTENLKKIEKYLKLKYTPVLIASHIFIKPKDKKIQKEINILKERLFKWITHWKNKDKFFFTYYDPLSFSKTSRLSFKAFMAKKQTTFSRYKWIDIFISQLNIIPGPYYYVTSFFELYRSPVFTSKGLKRLYWMKINGQFKIVASEWIQMPINLDAEYLTYHSDRLVAFLKKWKSAWEHKNDIVYANYYDKNAIQNSYIGLNSIIKHKKSIWRKSGNIKISFKNINIVLHKKGFLIKFIQKYVSNNHKDIGNKILIVYPFKNSYKIIEERWFPL
ncbi:L,D-transpeptidase family protein [Desulfothermus naphthae]